MPRVRVRSLPYRRVTEEGTLPECAAVPAQEAVSAPRGKRRMTYKHQKAGSDTRKSKEAKPTGISMVPLRVQYCSSLEKCRRWGESSGQRLARRAWTPCQGACTLPCEQQGTIERSQSGLQKIVWTGARREGGRPWRDSCRMNEWTEINEWSYRWMAR